MPVNFGCLPVGLQPLAPRCRTKTQDSHPGLLGSWAQSTAGAARTHVHMHRHTQHHHHNVHNYFMNGTQGSHTLDVNS